MSKSKPVTLAVVSDIHCGSSTAIVPPEGVRLDDGGTYHPSKANLWLWTCWEDFWNTVAAQRRETRSDLYVIYNGDLFEGDHHRTTQVVSANPETQDYLADRIYGVVRALHPKGEFVVRGTEAHVGPSGAAEEAFARRRQTLRDPETETWSWWHLRAEFNGARIEAQHHGRLGARPWTRSNAANATAAHIFYEASRLQRQVPQLVFRSHAHKYADSFNAHPVRVIHTPAWQFKTAFAHKVAPNDTEDIGGIIVQIAPSGRYAVEERLYLPEPGGVWRAS